MAKLWLIIVLLMGLSGPAQKAPWFSGLIVYHNEFRNAAGEVVESRVGARDLFYIQGSNYKLCDSTKRVRELYLGKTHTHQMMQDGKVTITSDTATHQPQVSAIYLPTTTVILGHPCHAVQLVHGAVASIIYYSPEVRVNPKGFSKSPFGYWYALLKATNGALPLRTISVYSAHGYTATSEATAVQPMPLTDQDFTFAAPPR
ncbi:hypothetical protein E4631_16550 [Hymenobacter sp. UV11]|uniref:hypothetical protein n=1 Tax=Hymenobacter sp. UV11 TaxID=1849735 RepID=UPI00105F1A46|nr:hypothetical protein [Hymenobacter sp. UV11]TDN37935.1 hypothetical protein A8B98_01380 [Hymenobacter sp. UV11]TFZ65147.1 hypothetical protein E4631_16550 [Hymenobacter sp. UV11]